MPCDVVVLVKVTPAGKGRGKHDMLSQPIHKLLPDDAIYSRSKQIDGAHLRLEVLGLLKESCCDFSRLFTC